ncbi:hypothetical protein A6M21_12785 [Desulfotomaculum copahuensis]|uniref:Uncharacterized protein n=1 Tax=Desulfotomaculum copahuensis TaxID=1838280 RepID=A0A1B7LCW4_9FIRM|nr:hypothetical protein A6M21_12785 [Desulfotomaculum copahuensis]
MSGGRQDSTRARSAGPILHAHPEPGEYEVKLTAGVFSFMIMHCFPKIISSECFKYYYSGYFTITWNTV